MAGEFGHMQVVPDGLPVPVRWTWLLGAVLQRQARWSATRASLIGVEPTMMEEACGGNPDQLTGPMVTAAAEAGDIAARHAFVSVGEWLGVGAANLVAAFDPDVVVVGGGVSGCGRPAAGTGPRGLAAVAGRRGAPGRAAAAAGRPRPGGRPGRSRRRGPHELVR